jgi:hypothetical protein
MRGDLGRTGLPSSIDMAPSALVELIPIPRNPDLRGSRPPPTNPGAQAKRESQHTLRWV